LNYYAETKQPKSFYVTLAIVIIIVTYVIAMTVGYLGYFAFGSSSKSLILFNLPSEDPLAVVAQLFYILTIAGSFVLLL